MRQFSNIISQNYSNIILSYSKICYADRIPNNSIPQIGVVYPDHWFGLLSGETLENQQLCPFLFQYFGERRFFCAIHNIKPVFCRVFEREDCRRRLEDMGLHGNVVRL